jgi:hypothetical protein
MIPRRCSALLCVLLLIPAATLRADGGAVRLREQVGAYQIAVFTSPTPFRAGPADISVLVQDAATQESIPDARIKVQLMARVTEHRLEHDATSASATNKLFQAAKFVLPEPGWWDVSVTIDGARGPARVQFSAEADAPVPRWQAMWPWFSWPFPAIALFVLHRRLAPRSSRRHAAPGVFHP